MSAFIEQSDSSNRLILLSENQQQNPFSVLENFFEDNGLSEVRSIFHEILKTCLSTDEGSFALAENRAILLTLHTEIQTVFEAVYIIAKLRASPADE